MLETMLQQAVTDYKHKVETARNRMTAAVMLDESIKALLREDEDRILSLPLRYGSKDYPTIGAYTPYSGGLAKDKWLTRRYFVEVCVGTDSRVSISVSEAADQKPLSATVSVRERGYTRNGSEHHFVDPNIKSAEVVAEFFRALMPYVDLAKVAAADGTTK